MFKDNPLKVMTAEVRLSYVHIDEPYAQEGSEPKYSAALLLPKNSVPCYNEIMAAIESAKQEGIKNAWKGYCPPNLPTPIYDGDGVREKSGMPYGEECHGCWVISAKSKIKPEVVHQSNIACPLPPGSVKSGDYARVMINFYPYDANGNRGVACSLGNIMVTREGEALGGRTSAADDFAGFASGGGEYAQPAPQQGYGAPPQQGYAPPQQGYAPPQQGYAPPQQGYAPPQQGYGAPAQPQFDPNAYMSGGYPPF